MSDEATGIWTVVVLVWILGAFIVAGMAKTRRRYAFGWGLVALFVSPVLAAIILLALTPPGETAAAAQIEAVKKCPQCAETVKAEAEICRFCRHSFVPEKLAAYRASRHAKHDGP